MCGIKTVDAASLVGFLDSTAGVYDAFQHVVIYWKSNSVCRVFAGLDSTRLVTVGGYAPSL
jgi:hypothetical protein